MVSDVIGSYPLFYSVSNDTVYVSDFAEIIAKKLHAKFYGENIKEFLKTGYVTENETVFKNIYTLIPASVVRIDKNSSVVTVQQWYDLIYNLNGKKTIEEFEKVLLSVFAELIERLNGRTALIPLSGGCDSRTVAVMFKKLGYENVVCFSYCKKGNFETERSKVIAENLGYRHIFVEYHADVWKDFYHSEEYHKFLDFSCRGRTIGCVQALPAIMDIKEKGLVPADAVVVPGHALDYNMGSHITTKMEHMDKQSLYEHIIAIHYSLRENIKSCGNTDKWASRISDTLDVEKSVCEYMKWEWINRQSKFIANDVRAYEFAGFSFELPFWDIRVVDFCAGLSFEQLLDRDFQYEFTKTAIDPIAGININYENKAGNTVKSKVKSIAVRILLTKYAIKWLRKVQWLWSKERHDGTNGFLSHLSDTEYKKMLRKYGAGLNINTVIADNYIERIKSKGNEKI